MTRKLIVLAAMLIATIGVSFNNTSAEAGWRHCGACGRVHYRARGYGRGYYGGGYYGGGYYGGGYYGAGYYGARVYGGGYYGTRTYGGGYYSPTYTVGYAPGVYYY